MNTAEYGLHFATKINEITSEVIRQVDVYNLYEKFLTKEEYDKGADVSRAILLDRMITKFINDNDRIQTSINNLADLAEKAGVPFSADVIKSMLIINMVQSPYWQSSGVWC